MFERAQKVFERIWPLSKAGVSGWAHLRPGRGLYTAGRGRTDILALLASSFLV